MSFVNEAGRVGVLLGVQDARVPKGFTGPLSDVRLVSIVLLRLDQLARVIEGGVAAREELAASVDIVNRLA